MAITDELNITTVQEKVLLDHLHNPGIDVIGFEFQLGTGLLKIQFVDRGGNVFHRSFNKMGHFRELI